MSSLSVKPPHPLPAVLCLVAGVASCLSGSNACSGWSPTRNVELISSAAPGGGPDLTARTVQKIWQAKRLVDASVRVVNKPGGNYSVAWNYLNQHPGDGHYLLMASMGLLTGRVTGASAISLADASTIARLFSEYMVLAVRADSPVKTGRDLARRLMKDPQSLSIAVGGGLGGVNHLATAMAMEAAGVAARKLKVIPFNSSAEAVVAVLGGHVDLVASTAAALLQAQSGKLRILAISAPQRVPGALAAVPTWREQGIDAVFDNFRVVLGPGGMSREQIAYWEAVFAGLTATADWKASLKANYWTAAYLNSRDCRKFLESQSAGLKAMLTELGMAQDAGQK